MKVRGIEYGKYELPLRKGLTTGSVEKVRKGIILEISLESTQGEICTGRGEIAPLPGISSYLALSN